MEPFVSIIIPVYNCGKYVQETLNSISALKDRTPYEIIIVNDGSTDAFTISKLDELRVTYHVIDKANGGVGSARNMGIAIAKGKYIMPLDGDDKIRSGIIDKSVKVLEDNVEVGATYCDAYCFGDGAGDWKMADFNLPALFYHNICIPSGCLFKKSTWQEVGGFDENFDIQGEADWDFWLAITTKGYKFYHIKEVLVEYRVFNTGSLRNFGKRPYFINHIMSKHTLALHESYTVVYNQKLTLEDQAADNKTELDYAYTKPFKFFIKAMMQRMRGTLKKGENNKLYIK